MGIILGINAFFFLAIIGTGVVVYLTKLTLDMSVGYESLNDSIADLNESLGAGFPKLGTF